MASKITPNTFFTSTGSSPKTTIFFISGNPGLIAYYHPFLSLLAKYLKDGKSSFQIYGCSLGGFEIGEDSPKAPILDLEDQIRFVQAKLATLMQGGSDDSTNAPKSRRNVILIGHSIGSYIAMEVLRRHRESPSPNTFDIIGGAMLFPTVKDIAASPSGQKLTVRLSHALEENRVKPLLIRYSQTLFSIIPRLALVVSLFARLLTFLLPMSLLGSVVRLVMGDPPSHALDATCSFLKSRGGVRQALYVVLIIVLESANPGIDTWRLMKCGLSPPISGVMMFGVLRRPVSLLLSWFSILVAMIIGLRSGRGMRL
jgi:pimeloyl-ACP methyl ester carboxylesterase